MIPSFCKETLEMLPFSLVCCDYFSYSYLKEQICKNFELFADINKATEEIGTLHRIDVSQVRTELLDEWLQPENFIANVSGNDFMMGLGDGDCFNDKLSNVEYENFQR